MVIGKIWIACVILATAIVIGWFVFNPPAHSLDYYKANAAERAQKLAACRQYPATQDPNCVSATAAEQEIQTDRFIAAAKAFK